MELGKKWQPREVTWPNCLFLNCKCGFFSCVSWRAATFNIITEQVFYSREIFFFVEVVINCALYTLNNVLMIYDACCRSFHQGYRHPSGECCYKLWLSQKLRNIPSQGMWDAIFFNQHCIRHLYILSYLRFIYKFPSNTKFILFYYLYVCLKHRLVDQEGLDTLV